MRRKITVHLGWTLAYLALGIPLLTLELVGVWRPGRGDTISENVWWLEHRFWPFRVFVTAFSVWLTFHFALG